MDASKLDLIQALHASPWQWVLVLTGGGAQAAADLLNVPGGSRTVLEVVVPYGEEALAEFLGQRPANYCSAETSRTMAARAWQRARWLSPRRPVLGVAATASLATDRPERGDHRFHVTIQSRERIATYSLTLAKDVRSRLEEEEVLDGVLLNALAEACGSDRRLAVPLRPEEKLQIDAGPAAGVLPRFLAGELSRLCIDPHGRWSATAPAPAALLSGSFNPLHDGHWRLAEVAGRILQLPVDFELSVINVDKPPLNAEEIDARADQIAGQANLWLSRAPTFVEKAELFPGAVFVVGMDTAIRIIDPKYYGQSEVKLAEALARMGEQGCRFLVAGRVDAGGRFQTIGEFRVPAGCPDLFSGIPESAYRLDISSTLLREKGK